MIIGKKFFDDSFNDRSLIADNKKKTEIRDKTVEIMEQIGSSEGNYDYQATEDNH